MVAQSSEAKRREYKREWKNRQKMKALEEKLACNIVQDDTNPLNHGTGEYDVYHFSIKRLTSNVPKTERPRVLELLGMAVDHWMNKGDGRNYVKELMLIQSADGVEKNFMTYMRLATVNWNYPGCKIVRETDPVRLLRLTFDHYRKFKDDEMQVANLCDFAAILLDGKKLWHYKHIAYAELAGDDIDKEFLILMWKSICAKKEDSPSSHAAFLAGKWGILGRVVRYSLEGLGDAGWGHFEKMNLNFSDTPSVINRPSHAYELMWAASQRWEFLDLKALKLCLKYCKTLFNEECFEILQGYNAGLQKTTVLVICRGTTAHSEISTQLKQIIHLFR